MNSIMKIDFMTTYAIRIILAWLVPATLIGALCQPVGGQQPGRHVLPQGEQVHRLPKSFQSFEGRTSVENDFVTNGSKSKDSEAIRDGNVRSAGFNESVHREREMRPLRDMATVATPRTKEWPWTYQLKNLNYGAFENKLAEIWGDRLLGTALDEEQRTLRLFLPEGKTAPEASVKFDRISGLLTFEGAPHRKAGFHRAMDAIDNHKEGVKVIDVSTMDESVVHQVVALIQDQEVPPRRQDSPNQLELPSDIDVRELSQGIRDANLQLKSKVNVYQNPETNMLILESTDPDDIKIIENYIESIKRDPSILQVETRRVELINENATDVLEKVRELYEGRLEGLYGEASINSATSSNSLVIVGKKSALDKIEKLIKDFDGEMEPAAVDPATGLPKPPTEAEKGYKRFVLRHISVDEAARAIRSLFNQNPNSEQAEQPEALLVNTDIDRRANALTVFGSQRYLRIAAALVEEMDVPSSNKKAERLLRVFKIKNHSAPDFQVILQDTLNGQFQNQAVLGLTESQLRQNANVQGGGGGLQDNQPVVPISNIRLQRADGTVTDVAVDFIDVRINSDAASNTIAVTAPAAAMEIIADIIDELDRLPDLFSEVKVFPVVNGDASEILATLDQIFNGTGQGAGGGGGGAQTGGLSDLPLQSSGGDGSTLVNINFAVNERTSTIIASGSPSDLAFVGDLIARLDEEDRRERVTAIYRLSNASVSDVEAALTSYLNDRDTFSGLSPLAGAAQNGAGITEGRRFISIAVEPSSNHLIVKARPEYIEEIDVLVRSLDRRPPMVKVKAQIIQVDLDQLENFGVEWGLQDSSIFDAGLSDTIGSGFVGLDNPAGQLLSDLGVGRMSSVAGVPGFVLSAGDESLNFILRFLKQKGCASVLFSPEITTVENLEGRVNQGASILRQGGTNQTLGVVTQDLTPTDIGITLAITPRVSPDGMIVMFVDVSNTSLGSEADGTVIGQDMTGAQIVSRPINQTVVQTTIMARTGQTVAISGLFQEEKSQTINSIPFLGDLPVVGPLFQSVENSANRSELLIILTPYILDGDDDIDALNKDDFDRMHWCKNDVAELYGTTTYKGVPYQEQATRVYYPDNDPLGRSPVVENTNSRGQTTPLEEEEWDGEGEQIFPPVKNDNRWRNQNEGSGTRSLDDELNSGSGTRSRLPFPTGRVERQGQRTAMQPVGYRNQRYDEPQRRSHRREQPEMNRNESSYRDSGYREASSEYMAPPRPSQIREQADNRRELEEFRREQAAFRHEQSGDIGTSQDRYPGPEQQRAMRRYPAPPRNASPVYQMNDQLPESQATTFRRR